jgi:hypothetical protein
LTLAADEVSAEAATEGYSFGGSRRDRDDEHD